jgi:hypothetical protein
MNINSTTSTTINSYHDRFVNNAKREREKNEIKRAREWFSILILDSSTTNNKIHTNPYSS